METCFFISTAECKHVSAGEIIMNSTNSVLNKGYGKSIVDGADNQSSEISLEFSILMGQSGDFRDMSPLIAKESDDELAAS